ncbi:Cytochrome P450 9e2 [Trachymyrmex septentrionalis]|uniref:Cytochrome P450 9e2 n=2 Tax=Trachymyrmex septentrionalis TaxID=34720 RepID=A0A151K0U2_9HYME|nr:Cytochrome P450 9e2 [Trachymyrmex septentrionalis]
MDTWILLSLLTGAIAIYYYFFKNLKFFEKHGITHIPPWPIVGNMGPVFLRQRSIAENIQKVYYLNKDAKYVGFFDGMNPIVMIRDPDLIKAIGVKNFETFPDHRAFVDEVNDPLFGKNLFSLRGEKWRDVRTLLSPAFTSSKMKTMFKLMSDCAANFTDYLANLPEDKNIMEMKNSFTRYTNDVIATCAFGISVDSMRNPNNEFYVYGKEATTFNTLRTIKFYLARSMPLITKMLGIKFVSNNVGEFFKDLVRNTIHTRDVKNIVRPDMLQLMMETRGKRGPGKELTIEDMTAQAFIFFFGGFDTVSSLMCFAVHEIAVNPDVQAKLRDEVDEVLKTNNGDLTYEALNGMQYLDAVINEALRKWPIAAFLDRINVEDFELPPALPGDKPFLLKKGMNVWFPVYGLHRDPKYFERPDEFDPERFLDENKKDINSAAYLPFGLGPRMCIGNRFALLETKVMLFHLLSRCELKMCAKTSHPLQLSTAFMIANKFVMEYWPILLSILISVISIYYLFRNFNFFKRHGVIHVPPVPIFGSMTSVIFGRMSFFDFILKIYHFNPDAKYFGIYVTTNPIFLLRDPELIKTILVKNFDAFPNRRGFNELNQPLLAKNLFSLRGERWRNVRTLLSPSFTSSKMKMMFTLMSECAVNFTKFLSTLPADKSDMNMKDVFSKYTNDVIATCAFGIKVDSMKDPTNKFYVYGKEATSFLGSSSLKFIFLRTFPNLGRILNLKLINDYVLNFFKDIIKTTIATRDTEHITRPDMLQLMMDIRGEESRRELDIDDMVAQAFVFFFGGFDTSSTAMSFVAHEIAANPEVQNKLQQEIDKVLEESNGKVSYEVINRLEYLDAVINETLRLYPPVTFLERMCEKTYELPPALPDEKPFIMKKGMTFWIPIFAIHRDKKYYDDPEKFDPERFLNNKMHNSLCYMPFGLGPRMCIANRFALLEVKILLFHLLARCELKPSMKTTSPIKFGKTLLMMPENGFWLNIQRRKDTHPVLESI